MITMWVAAARAAVLDVGAGHPHATLTDALASAADGDVIVLHDTVVGTFTVDGLRNLVIRGDPQARWAVPYSAANPHDIVGVQLLNDAQVRFVGINFFLDGTLAIEAEGDVVVERSTFSGLGNGIWVESGSVAVSRTKFSSLSLAIGAGDGTPVDVADSLFIGNPGVLAFPVIDALTSTVNVTRSAFVQNGALLNCETCTITDSAFVGNTSPVQLVWGQDAVLERNRFCGNLAGPGPLLVLNGTVTLRNNAFLDNQGDFVASVILNDHELTLEHNTFLGNASSGMVALSYGPVSMVGNLVAGSDGSLAPAIGNYGIGSVTSESYNAWYDNAGGDASFPLDATDLVGVDPLLVGGGRCSWDRIRPTAGSPLIDGDPTLLDADGTPADIGATGGPAAP